MARCTSTRQMYIKIVNATKMAELVNEEDLNFFVDSETYTILKVEKTVPVSLKLEICHEE